MKSTIKSFCNFVVIIFVVISVTYVSFFTDIPTKTGNVIRKQIEENTNSFEEYSNEFQINELGISMDSYYYNFLSDDQKRIYESIANGVKNFQSEFVVRDYVADDKDKFASEVSIAIEAFINDHPEVFYLESEYSSYILFNILLDTASESGKLTVWRFRRSIHHHFNPYFLEQEKKIQNCMMEFQ